MPDIEKILIDDSTTYEVYYVADELVFVEAHRVEKYDLFLLIIKPGFVNLERDPLVHGFLSNVSTWLPLKNGYSFMVSQRAVLFKKEVRVSDFDILLNN